MGSFPDFLSTGRYRVLVLVSDDILSSGGISSQALDTLCSITILGFTHSVIELVVAHPFSVEVRMDRCPRLR